MKMTKKILLGASFALTLALTSCMGVVPDDLTIKDKGTKFNLTIDVKGNDDYDKEVGTFKYQRAFKQLGSKETVQSLETLISVDTTGTDGYIHNIGSPALGNERYIAVPKEEANETVHAVVGLIFDLHKTKEKDEDGKKVEYYDFAIVGYRPYDDGIYIEKYENISKELFEAATNASDFGNATKYITHTNTSIKEKPYVYNGHDWVDDRPGKLGKDDDGKEYDDEVPLKRIRVKIEQRVPGCYEITAGGTTYEWVVPNEEEAHPDWYTKDNPLTKNVDEGGYRIGGAGYYVNVPLGTQIKANFNSKQEGTKGLEEEVVEE